MQNYTAIVTLLALSFYSFTGIAVAKARAKFGVNAPATTGHPDFERVFRVQMNTLEWLPLFLPPSWLFAIYFGDLAAAALGLVWIFGRILELPGLHRRRRETRNWVYDSNACRKRAAYRRNCWRHRQSRRATLSETKSLLQRPPGILQPAPMHRYWAGLLPAGARVSTPGVQGEFAGGVAPGAGAAAPGAGGDCGCACAFATAWLIRRAKAASEPAWAASCRCPHWHPRAWTSSALPPISQSPRANTRLRCKNSREYRPSGSGMRWASGRMARPSARPSAPHPGLHGDNITRQEPNTAYDTSLRLRRTCFRWSRC